LQRGKELARRHDLHFITHISETEDEVRMIAERYGTTSTQHLEQLGLLDEKTIGAHCVHVTDRDIELLKERGVAVSHNPQSNMKLASGIAPVAEMHRRGVLCTIGTDGTCSNNDLDMWEEMRSASFLQKVAAKDPLTLPAYEILKMVTVNAARAIGHGGELGIIAEGALADFMLVDTRKPHLTPIYNMVANLVYCGKAADVDTVVVDGVIVVEDRRIKGLDLSELCAKVQTTAISIAEIKK
jgi:5-methylthioadenosine/S-adenosylhomocysteine deaminase